MNCNDTRNRLDDFLDGRLAPASSDEFGAHVARCAPCRHRLAQAQALASALRQIPVEPAPEGFEDRVLKSAAESSSARPHESWLGVGSLAAACAAGLLALALIAPHLTAPSSEEVRDLPVVAVTVDQPQTVNLVFASTGALENVSLRVELPEGVEIAGYAGRREIVWRASMQAGKNVLPLELVARESASGEIVARLQHDDMERTFRIFVSAARG